MSEPPVFRGMRLSAKDAFWDVPADFDRKLAETFPEQDRQETYRRIALWLETHPRRRKTARGMTAFIGGWFERNQNRGSVPLPIQQRETYEAARQREQEARRDRRTEESLDGLRDEVRRMRIG